jgi:hypothetical protein
VPGGTAPESVRAAIAELESRLKAAGYEIQSRAQAT